MITSARATWALCLATLTLGACSLVVDFDRAKLRSSDASVADDAATDGGTGSDGGKPDGGRDGGPDGGPEGGIDASGSCEGDEQCGLEDLCCDGVCTPARPINGCATCGGAACGDGADRCASRACACGDGAACSDGTPYCAEKLGGAPGEMTCVACRGDTDCGTTQVCVQQQCRDCDHTKGNTGCQNPTPICAEDDTCVACDAGHACPSPLACNPGLQGGCFGCDDNSNAGCDGASTTPICDAVTGGLQCEGCAADAECTGNASGTQCNMNGACRVCDARDATNPGCTDPARRFCDQNGACRGCTDGDCTSGFCAKSGALQGQCVGCTANRQCALDPDAPTCGSSGTCRACTGRAGDCDGSLFGAHCNTQSGRCVQCTQSTQCGGTTPNCDTQTFRCVQCLTSNDCSGNTPVCQGGACVACRDALGGGTVACTRKDPSQPACQASGACGVCNASNEGCSGAAPYCNATQNACVACTATNQCAADDGNACTAAPACLGGACVYAPACDASLCIDPVTGCRPCNPATNAGCAAPTPVCNATYVCEAAPAVGG